ncbi:crotonase/enoyl-CoA hydratase family protein [Vibrio chaetopteri]|jgi:enoyl-CoA hydratase/carnithine racemase|uniref:Crotonase/enoyl-CoA hydratase family protein n=1 Tax=Vibrio chaetopteri TaxID=3016528 RepID=A0AAU8BGS9_9VIBR
MDYKRIKVSRTEDVVTVTLNRPDKLNGVDMGMFEELIRVSRALRKDRQLRAVILTGSGDNFSSGLDFKSMMTNKSNAAKLLFKWWPGQSNRAQQVSSNWRKLSVPVIAAIDGYCWGAGMQIALGADFRICSPKANLSIMESKMGLTSDMAGSIALREVMPKDRAMLISICGQELSAEEALKYGLVTEVCEVPLEAAQTLANKVKRMSPDVNAAMKHMYTRYWTAPAWKLLAYETYSQIRIMLGRNFGRMQSALRKKAPPEFQPRQRYW